MNYLNTNHAIIDFDQTIHDDIYVDKSLFIEKISNNINKKSKKFICITRPRRFGKTINAQMLTAYYIKGYNTHYLFDHLKISQTDNYQKYINQHNVIYIDLSERPRNCHSYIDFIDWVQKKIEDDLVKQYKIIISRTDPLSDLFKKTQESFIFILDEWDSIFYEDFMSDKDKIAYLKFLKGLLKDQPYVELAYLTGVLPIAKYSSGSELNMFREYNFMNDYIYQDYFGFNEEEVKELCSQNDRLSYEQLKYWYDGYYTTDGRSLFNPRSVNNALNDSVCLNYWTETGPMNEIADCIEHNVDEVREDIVNLVAGNPIEIQLNGYSAVELQLDTRDEILSAMVVFGFLSYYDGKLTIPNYELMQKFQSVLSRKSMGGVKEIVDSSKEILEATLELNAEKVADMLEEVHDREIPFLQYNDENSLSCVITLCYLYARNDYRIIRESKSGKGYCDYVFIPKKKNKPAIILELKINKSANEALQQIKDKNYLEQVKDYDEIIIVGINYDRDKHHECIIEKIRN